MAEFKVDEVHYHYSKTSGKLEVWCFNDEKAYSEKARKRMAKYDFGRKPNNEDGKPTDRKQKLLIGLYREPYKDGWKYTINTKVLPMLADTVFRYIFFGYQVNEDGEIEPFTYLRHNRKALGIVKDYAEAHNYASSIVFNWFNETFPDHRYAPKIDKDGKLFARVNVVDFDAYKKSVEEKEQARAAAKAKAQAKAEPPQADPQDTDELPDAV